MTPDGLAILQHLGEVASERRRRGADPDFEARTRAVKDYQHRRFAMTYADLLASPRYRAAARFFLDELYGPHDFTARDEQFERVVPGLVRLFPEAIVATVRALAELHALSERLDSAMAERLPGVVVRAEDYVRAWQATGEAAARRRQIELMLEVGQALDRYTRNPLLRHSLRLMRGPARAAGLSALQQFLESGFDTFRELGGASEFLRLVTFREQTLCDALFATGPVSPGTFGGEALGQLP